MEPKKVLVLFVSLLVLSGLLIYGFSIANFHEEKPLAIFVGVDVAYENATAVTELIDEVSAYTNLFVIGSKGITYDTAKLNETCQYLYDKGLYFMVYRDTPLRNSTWLETAKNTWGEFFLGYYAFDELGGYQLDQHEYRMVVEAENYSDAANSFVSMAKWYLDMYARFRNTTQFGLFTSDYTLYWFDYEAGYDAVFAQLGWNYSRQLNVALCRGAARMHQKEWGAIITWTYTHPPYIESGEELYEDLILAYENGAKYILIFDSNENYTESILKQEHFDVLKRFWQYAKDHPVANDTAIDRVAYVLPQDYGYGFRGPNDRVWGFWEADALSNKLCMDLGSLLEEYGSKLDIIYDDGLETNSSCGYTKLIFWNGTTNTNLEDG